MEESYRQRSDILGIRKLSMDEPVDAAGSSSVGIAGHQRPVEDGAKFYDSSHNSTI